MTAHANRTATKATEPQRTTVRGAGRPAPTAARLTAEATAPALDPNALISVPSQGAPATRIRRSATAADRAHRPEDITDRVRRAPTGRPLDATVQRRLEGALDTSLANVRVHTDRASDSMARDINARAFATGSDIYFRSGEYRPNDRSGMETIAHEVVHTTQQSAGGTSGTRIGRMHLSDPTDRDEREASSVASRIVRRADAAPAGHERAAQATIHRRAASTRIRRIAGEATRLRGVNEHYDDEETVQRPDLRGVVLSYGEMVSGTWNTMQALQTATDAGSITAAKNRLNVAPILAPVRARIAPMTKEEALAEVTRVHDTQFEKAVLQDIGIDAQGNIDMAALNARLVTYDKTLVAQHTTRVTVSGGKLKRSNTHAQPGEPVDTAESVTQHSGKGWEIFVVGASGNIHMASHKIGKYHHSSLLGGAPVSMAGEMKVSAGKIVTMSNKSGHYAPTPQHFQHFLRTLERDAPLDFNVTGFGFSNGRADAWLASLDDRETPEFFDAKTVMGALGTARVAAYLFSAPPAGLGWRRRSADGSMFDKPDPNGSGTWVPVGHDEFRRTVEAKFGKAKQKVERTGASGTDVTWL